MSLSLDEDLAIAPISAAQMKTSELTDVRQSYRDAKGIMFVLAVEEIVID